MLFYRYIFYRTKVSKQADVSDTPLQQIDNPQPTYIDDTPLQQTQIHNPQPTYIDDTPQQQTQIDNQQPTYIDDTPSQQIESDSQQPQQQKIDTDKLNREILILQAEISMLKSENEKLQQETGRFLFKQIAASDKLVSLYTGLPNAKIFYSIVNYIKRLDFEYVYGWRVE